MLYFTCLLFLYFIFTLFALLSSPLLYLTPFFFTFLPFPLFFLISFTFHPFSLLSSHFLYFPPLCFTFHTFTLLASLFLYLPPFYFTFLLCRNFPRLFFTFLPFALLSSSLLYLAPLCCTCPSLLLFLPICFIFSVRQFLFPSALFYFTLFCLICRYFAFVVLSSFQFSNPSSLFNFPPHHLVLPSSLYIIPFWSDLHLLWWSFIDYLLHIPLFYCSPAFVSLPLRKCSSLCRSPFSLCIALPASAAVRVLYCVPLPRDVWCGIDLMASSPREWRLRNVYDAASWRHVLGHARGGFNLPRASSSFSSSSRSFVSLVKFFEAKHLFPGH